MGRGGERGVSVALKSGRPNSHLCPRRCKNGDFSCVCKKWQGWQFFESQLQLRANLDISQQVKSSLFSRLKYRLSF